MGNSDKEMGIPWLEFSLSVYIDFSGMVPYKSVWISSHSFNTKSIIFFFFYHGSWCFKLHFSAHAKLLLLKQCKYFCINLIYIQTENDYYNTNGSPNLDHTAQVNNKKRRTCKIMVFADHTLKLKECEKKDKYLGLARELKNLWNMKVTFIPIVIIAPRIVTKRLIKRLGNKRTNGGHPNNCIIDIGKDTEKSPGNLRRLAATQTFEKDHQLTPMWKTLKE